jgi:mRNA interferase MazF
MIKRRPAVVVSPRLPHRDGLCTVIPLSGTEPAHDVAYCVKLTLTKPFPPPFDETLWWAKCDMIATVGFDRLDFFRSGRDQDGKRKYLHPVLPASDMARIKSGILAALGMTP